MSMMKGYYASFLIAGGAVLMLAAPDNWMLQVVAYAVISGGAVMRAADRSAAPEWVLLAVWSVGCILPILSAVMGLNAALLEQVTGLTAVLQPLGCIALLLDAFRAQQQYIRLEVDKT